MADESKQPVTRADDASPSPARQAELEAAYQGNLAEGNPPYDGVFIQSLGELLWVMSVRGWTGTGEDNTEADFRLANLANVNLAGVTLIGAHLEAVDLANANLTGANLQTGHLERANLGLAMLESANLAQTHLEAANLAHARLKGADLRGAHLEGANLVGAELIAGMQGAFFDAATTLDDAILTDGRHSVSLADVRWGNANVSVIDWQSVLRLGDEVATRTRRPRQPRRVRVQMLTAAVRAYRQVAAVLAAQGLVDDAARFGYRSLVLQRAVFLRQRRFGQYVFSSVQDVLSGYGYRSARSFLAYVTVVLAFAIVFYWYGLITSSPISPEEAMLVSLVSFHGRGFLTGGFPIKDVRAGISLAEAVIGVFVEAAIVAAFTQHPGKE